MRSILEAQDVMWQDLKFRGEMLDSSSILGAISGLAVLPEIRGDDEQKTNGFDDTADDNASRTSGRGHILPAGHTGNETSGDDLVTRLPKSQKIGMCGGRAVLATCAVDGVPGSTTGLGVLEHGFGLDATAEGGIGLPEGSTLYAQRVALGGAARHHSAQHGSSCSGGNGGATGRRRGGEEMSYGSTVQEGHVLLLSDRVRSRTNVLVSTLDGEVAPAVSGANKVRGLVDTSRHYVLLLVLSR